MGGQLHTGNTFPTSAVDTDNGWFSEARVDFTAESRLRRSKRASNVFGSSGNVASQMMGVLSLL